MRRVLMLTFLLLLGCDGPAQPQPTPSGGWHPPRVHEDLIGTHDFQLRLSGRQWLFGVRNGRDLDYAIALPSHVNCAVVTDLVRRSVDGMGAYPVLLPRDGTREIFFVDRKVSIPEYGQLFALDYDGTINSICTDGLDLSPIESQMILRVSYPEPLPPSTIRERILDTLHGIEQREKQRAVDVMLREKEKDGAK